MKNEVIYQWATTNQNCQIQKSSKITTLNDSNDRDLDWTYYTGTLSELIKLQQAFIDNNEPAGNGMFLYKRGKMLLEALNDELNERYAIEDRETGNVIEYFDSEAEAEKCLLDYEKQDKEDGTYIEDFYFIRDNWLDYIK